MRDTTEIGGSSALMLLDRSELHGHYTPTFDNDKARNFGTPARKGALKGLPVELPPIPDALLAKDAKPLELSDLYHACQVSFVPAENMRRSSIAFGQLATLPPPETCEDGLKIVCLVNPLIEALESFHEDLGEKMHSLSAEVEKLRSEVEHGATDVPSFSFFGRSPAQARSFKSWSSAEEKMQNGSERTL